MTHTIDNSSVLARSWSSPWKLCVVLAAFAVTLDLLMVQYPMVWLGVAGVVAVLAQFRSPLSGLAVVIFACGLANYSPFEMGPLSRLYPGDVAIGVFILAWLLSSTSWPPRNLFPSSVINKPLLGIALVTPVSMLWSRLHTDPEVTYAFPHSDVSWATTQISTLVLLAATLCIPFAVSAGIKRWKDVETVVIIMGVVVAIGTLLTAGALMLGFGGTYRILGATRAYWGQPWDTSVEPLSAICLPFLFAAVLFGRGSVSRYRVMCGLCALCFLGLVLTFSRETWLLGFFGLLLVSAAWLKSRINPAYGLLIVIVVFVIIVFSGVIGLVSSFYNPEDVYGFERIYYYASALQLFATHPFLGVGAGDYQFFDRTYSGQDAAGIAHNQFLTEAAETGLLGLGMFLWLIFGLIRIRRQLRFAASPLGGCPTWVKVGGSAFLLIWIAECFFQECFFATAAAAGGTHVMTLIIFPWVFLGVLLAACNLSEAPAPTESSVQRIA